MRQTRDVLGGLAAFVPQRRAPTTMPKFEIEVFTLDQRKSVEAPTAKQAAIAWAKEYIAAYAISPATIEDMSVIVTNEETQETQTLRLEIEYYFEVHAR